MSKASATNLNIAVERVGGFAQKFDRSHFDLACHAAFPQTLTPDLLYQIWLRFVPQAPWTAVARILLSRLCREVGYELYEMDVAVRNLLLTEMKEDERFGKQQLAKLADFHTNYLKQQLGSEKKQGEDLTQSQYWIALANSHPNQVNRQLAEAIELRSKQENWRELFRLTSLIESVPKALVEFDASLITYTRGMLSYTTGDLGGAIEEFSKLQRRDRLVDIAGINLSIPNDISLPTIELEFLKLVLQGISNSDGDPDIIYRILRANLGNINYKLAELLREWAATMLLNVDLEGAQAIAVVIVNFSNLLFEFPLGSRADNLEIAIVGYEISSGIFTKNESPTEWAITQGNLGNAYIWRIRGEKAENIEIAIRYFLSALEIYTYETFPKGWAMTQGNLGNTYIWRIRGERAENIEIAISCFLSALMIYTREWPTDRNWAKIQGDLGKAYSQRIRGEKTENIETAISCFNMALTIFTYRESPQDWADIQNNLAIAYTERIEGNWAANLEQAISCSQNALQVYTPESFPHHWAQTQNNLGIAFRDRLKGDRPDNLEQAIDYFQNALQVYTRESFPQNWAETQNNLGIAFRDRIGGDRYENLEQAISCFQNALQVYTRESLPQSWAETQNNLGIAFRDRIGGDRRNNLEQAISYFQNALQVYTPKSFPQNWAETQNNLGIAFRDRIGGDRYENLEQAIYCFRAALEIYTHGSFPKNYLETLFNLAITYQSTLQLFNAYEAFAKIIDALESDQGKQQEFTEQSNKAYQHMVEVCLELGYIDRAIEYIEQNKGHSSIELLVNYNINPKNNVSELNLNKLKILSVEILLEHLQLKSKGRNLFLANGIIRDNSQLLDNFLVPHHQTRLAQLQEQMDELIIQEDLPKNLNFNLNQRVDPITFDRIKSLVPDEKTAILEWYLQDDNFQTFIITKESDAPSVWQSSQRDNSALTEWSREYFQDYQENQPQWQEQLSLRIQNLAQILHIDELIRHLPTSCDRLILIPHRVLHCIPLHALPLADGSCLLDRFTGGVRYIPSCQLLKLVQTRQRRDFDRFLAIQNPTGDLLYTNMEVQAIQQFFPFGDILNEAAATKDALNQQKLNAHCLHFTGHSDFNINSPLQSRLMLADEPLSLAEVFTLDLTNCRLVTLSASETALTSWTDTSDDYLGFPSAFLLAGSNSVVGSFWDIDDLSTALLMIKFYQNLQTGSTIAIALNQAQLWLRNLTKLELEQWISENLWRLSATLKMSLRRRLYLLSDDTQPFVELFHWAAFATIGQ
jgi:CHAT domain-containing protein